MVDFDRLLAAYQTAHCDLLAESDSSGHWPGQLASSPLATATAVSALGLVGRHAPAASAGNLADDLCRGETSRLIIKSLRWLMTVQQADGGWSDVVGAPSNIVATMLVRAAFSLTCVPGDDDLLLERADAYIQQHGSVAAVRRYCAGSKAHAAAVLTNLALAGLASWSDVPQLPFELAADATEVWNRTDQPVAGSEFVPHDLAAVIAIGQARFKHRKPLNPLVRSARTGAIVSSLANLEAVQPASGGFLESVPLTSFVVMSLANSELGEHAVVRRSVEFLLTTVRGDGSWTLGAEASVRNTAAVMRVLMATGERVEKEMADWLLDGQINNAGVKRDQVGLGGGWATTDRAGLPANCADTASVLLALAALPQSRDLESLSVDANQRRILDAAKCAVDWLLDRQNDDGGWPLMYRGDGKLALCRSASEVTADVVRALHNWRSRLVSTESTLSLRAEETDARHELGIRIAAALEDAVRFLQIAQQAQGSWNALWLGNPLRVDLQSPTLATARVLLAFRDLGNLDTTVARRGLDWLASAQNDDGGWGARAIAPAATPATTKANSAKNAGDTQSAVVASSVEETAAAVECLASCGRAAAHEAALDRGVEWLSDAVESNRHVESSPISLDFAKLWYRDKLTPMVGAAAALGQALRRHSTQTVLPLKLH